jgi:hypothetical protein
MGKNPNWVEIVDIPETSLTLDMPRG